MKTQKTLALGFTAAALMFAVTNNARAALVDIGGPQDVGSWAQRFEEQGVGPYDRMEAFMEPSGAGFEANGFANFGAVGWSSSLVNPTYILANGGAQTYMQFDIKFNGPQSDPLTFDFLAWNGDQLLERAVAVWNGGAWNISLHPGTYDPSEYDRAAVPEPATMIAGALLLLPLGASTVRVLRKNRKV